MLEKLYLGLRILLASNKFAFEPNYFASTLKNEDH